MLKIGRYDYGAYGIFSTYAICSLMLPLVMVDIGRDLNFPLDAGGMGKGGTILLLRSFAMLASLLFCDPLAKRLGKRYTMGLSMLLCGTGIFCAGFSQSFLCLICLLTLSGLGEGICEGIATPFLNDLHQDNPSCYVSIGHSFWSVGTVLAVLMVTGLHSCGLHWRYFLGGAGLLALLSTLPFFLPEQKGKEYPENLTNLAVSEAGEGTWKRTCKILDSGRFWLYCAAMFVCAGAELSLSCWAASFIRLTICDSVSMGALATASIAAGMFAGRICYGKYVPQSRLWHLLMGSALAGIPIPISKQIVS